MSNEEQKQNYLADIFKVFSWRGPIGFFIVVASYAFLFMCFYRKIPAENKEVITFAAGQVLVLAGVVVGWHFGSSKKESDAAKVEQVKSLLTQTPPDGQ